jgi:hypothetical protein
MTHPRDRFAHAFRPRPGRTWPVRTLLSSLARRGVNGLTNDLALTQKTRCCGGYLQINRGGLRFTRILTTSWNVFKRNMFQQVRAANPDRSAGWYGEKRQPGLEQPPAGKRRLGPCCR